MKKIDSLAHSTSSGMRHRWILTTVLWASTLVALSACAPPVGRIIMEANRQNDERAVERGKGLLAQHLQLIDKLRAEGDPMGDYLWTQANADKWVENPIQDPLVLEQMYEAAAAKGSVDAEHVLGVMLFNGVSSRNVCYTCPVLKPEDRNPQRGLEMIERASAKQCFYWGIQLDGMANRHCLTPVVTAGTIWPKYRDGRLVEQDTAQAERWRQMELTCQATLQKLPPQFFIHQRFPACR
jgi:hypothetical protein